MAQISVRNLDDQVVERLKHKARRHGRSLESEVRAILEEAAQPSREEALRSLASLREEIAQHNGHRMLSDSTEILREDRSR